MRILIIEDEKNILELYQDWLEDEGHNVVTSQNGLEGINKLIDKKLDQEKIDFVITDLNMPGRDGFEVIEVLRETNIFKNQVPILVISGFVNQYVREELEELGNIFVIEKPAKKEQILSIIQKLKD